MGGSNDLAPQYVRNVKKIPRYSGDKVEQLNSHAVDLFNLYNLHQHVSVATHVSGNVSDPLAGW